MKQIFHAFNFLFSHIDECMSYDLIVRMIDVMTLIEVFF